MAGAGFGEHLKREREMRGVSLDEIAGATRIGTRFLEALEQEAWERLPGGVFNRGFVRTIARYLGLEEESLLAEYSLARGEHSTPKPKPKPTEPPASALSSSKRVPWMALAAIPIVLALAVGGWFGWRWVSARRAELEAAATSLPAAPEPPGTPSNLWAGLPEPLATSQADATTLSASAGTSPENGQDMQLIISAAKDTILTITTDGQAAFSGTLAAGQTRTLSAKTSITVETQDAGAIHMELNGQTLAPLGPLGQPGRITLGHLSAPGNAGGHN